MDTKHFLVWLFIALVSPVAVSAAVLHGIVYDLSLDRITEAQVTIDTTPVQRQITQNGEYRFEVPSGTFTITAEYYKNTALKASIKEKVLIEGKGSYVYDLILFPAVSEGVEIDEDLNLTGRFLLEEERKWTDLILIIAFLIFLGSIIYLFQKRKEPQFEDIQDQGLAKLLQFIKKEKRTTQKDVRRQFPQSEAKISLMLAELEEKKLIRKIKKGRGNIIIFQKK